YRQRRGGGWASSAASRSACARTAPRSSSERRSTRPSTPPWPESPKNMRATCIPPWRSASLDAGAHSRISHERSPVSEPWWVSVIKALVIINLVLLTFAYTTLLERKLLARMQLRFGPNRAGPYGLLQPF